MWVNGTSCKEPLEKGQLLCKGHSAHLLIVKMSMFVTMGGAVATWRMASPPRQGDNPV